MVSARQGKTNYIYLIRLSHLLTVKAMIFNQLEILSPRSPQSYILHAIWNFDKKFQVTLRDFVFYLQASKGVQYV